MTLRGKRGRARKEPIKGLNLRILTASTNLSIRLIEISSKEAFRYVLTKILVVF